MYVAVSTTWRSVNTQYLDLTWTASQRWQCLHLRWITSVMFYCGSDAKLRYIFFVIYLLIVPFLLSYHCSLLSLQFTDQHWIQTTIKFCLINDFGCSTYSSVHCRRQSVSCYSRSSVEQSSITHHWCPSLSPSSAVVLNHISFHFLIPLSGSSLIFTVPVQWLAIFDTIIFFYLHLFVNYNSVCIECV